MNNLISFGATEYLNKVKSYSINRSKILGQGAFGVVFKGTDAKENAIAAKRIDGNIHPRILTQDLQRLMKLDHPNVMKILDVDKYEKIVWVMMPFCDRGDLNYFHRTKDFSSEVNLEIMKQIVAGIDYLHNQDIVHRDIKPGNILITSEAPLRLLLADFDVSKCLDPEVVTSLMTSNVGTLAFKAPEFFQRTSPGKIKYHRNVDVYAAGLTFLAILQAKKGQKMLIPKIETPMDDSELHVPSIGLLISERIKYKVPELNIVKIEGVERSLKWLISRMTCVNPEERWSAGQALLILNNLETFEVDLTLGIQKVNFVCEKTNEQVPGLLTTDIDAEKQIVARVQVDNRFFIRVRNQSEISEIASECDHRFACLLSHPTDADFLLEGCCGCNVIRNYNLRTGEHTIVHWGTRPIRMCHGPFGFILVQCREPYSDFHTVVSAFRWDKEQKELCYDKSIILEGKLLRICCAERFNVLTVVRQNQEIEAKNLESDTTIWKLSGVVDGHMIKPEAVTADADGNIYVSDGANKRILKINGLTGNVVSILLLAEENKRSIRDLFCSDTKSNLTLISKDRISTCSILKIN